MNNAQTYLPVTAEALLARVRDLRDQKWRLVQMGATPVGDALELNYSFDRGGELLNLRLGLKAAAARAPSISGVYWCAFIYENEIHDLFRVSFDGLVLDYQGKFYRTSVPYPFAGRGQPTVGVTTSGAVRPLAPVTPAAPAAPAAQA